MIHKTAIIDPKAKISSSVEIGPYVIIGPNVEIGNNSIIQSHSNIVGYTSIGKNNNIYPFASIGNAPQDMKYNGEKTKLIIGDNNTIREYVTINPGTIIGGGLTKVGNKNLIMISAHIAHDCIVGNNIVIANNAAIAGHAIIEDNVVIGGNCGVQQFTRIGKMAMIGGMTGVSRDVIPYGLSTGNRNYLNGINVVGLRRSKVPNTDIIGLTDAYKEIFRNESLNENLNKLNGDFKDNPLVKEVVEFINKNKKRPICTPFLK
jgi:UDP-N-acetylglucosamine acyltransferase